jgi:AcrR family transcriptional regulator
MSTKIENAQLAGLKKYSLMRKEVSRQKLVEAAEVVFKRRGYASCSVDDIVQEAAVSRPTFYSHFPSKFAIAVAYLEENKRLKNPLWTSIGQKDFYDRSVVAKWITGLFNDFRDRRAELPIFYEMSSLEPKFFDHMKDVVPTIIEQLGDTIPAFAAMRGKDMASRVQMTDASLYLWHLRDVCFAYAVNARADDRKLVIENFTEAFLRIVNVGRVEREKTEESL